MRGARRGVALGDVVNEPRVVTAGGNTPRQHPPTIRPGNTPARDSGRDLCAAPKVGKRFAVDQQSAVIREVEGRRNFVFLGAAG